MSWGNMETQIIVKDDWGHFNAIPEVEDPFGFLQAAVQRLVEAHRQCPDAEIARKVARFVSKELRALKETRQDG